MEVSIGTEVAIWNGNGRIRVATVTKVHKNGNFCLNGETQQYNRHTGNQTGERNFGGGQPHCEPLNEALRERARLQDQYWKALPIIETEKKRLDALIVRQHYGEDHMKRAIAEAANIIGRTVA